MSNASKRFWVSTALVTLLGLGVSKPNLVSFIYSWPASEFAQIWLLAQTVNLAQLFQSSSSEALYDSKLVKVGLLLNFVAMKAGAENLALALKSRSTFAKALRDQAGIAAKSGESFASTLPGALLSLVPLLAVSRRGKQVKIERNIPYANIDEHSPELLGRWKRTPRVVRTFLEIARGRTSQWMTLNVFHLEGSTPQDKRPVLVSFHGGAWALADKWISAHSLFQRIASRGVVVCIINYRMSPEALWPTHIQDCKRGLIFAKKHCEEWGGDANQVFITGESAGAHLCALTALTQGVQEFQPPEDPTGDTSVRGALPLYGIFDFTNTSGSSEILLLFASKVLFQQPVSYKALQGDFSTASPLYHLKRLDEDAAKQVPPFFSMHGTKDVLAPYADFKLFVREFRAMRAKYGQQEKEKGDVFVTLPGAHHAVGFFPSLRNDALADAMCDFIYHHSAPKQQHSTSKL